MSYEMQITRSAENDLNNAADYIEFVLCNAAAADSLLDEAEMQIKLLAKNPKTHAVIDDPILKAWKLRFIVIKNYLAFYLVSEPKKRVYIIRFLYAKRDWISILQTSLPIQWQNGEFNTEH